MVGKHVIHPFRKEKIPIIADSFVDPAFGTGAVKITPAHDFNDYEVGKRHSLPMLNILNDDGTISAIGGQFAGMKRFDARNAVLAALKELGSFRDIKDNVMNVPICSRSKDIVEPIIKPQWFVNCDEMAKRSIAAVKNGDLKIIPQTHEKTWYYWLENIRDWCISRQLWWGHRIPAYYARITGEPATGEEDLSRWFVARTEQEALEAAAQKLGVSKDKITLEQDPDVLDTWFSSALFPFSIFGWPNGGQDYEIFYPGTLLETGLDILFFWVARMVFFGFALTDKLPFKEVYLHPIVRDAHGKKMSKSSGNVIDPVDVITGISLQGLHDSLKGSNLDPKDFEKACKAQKEDFPEGIPECGTDALRFALLSYLTQGRDINLDVKRVVSYRHFCNKLWNATKFAMMNLGASFVPTATESHLTSDSGESLVDKWILSRLANAVEQVNSGLKKYEFPSVTNAAHTFWLLELCDVYLESIKPVFRAEEVANQALAAAASATAAAGATAENNNKEELTKAAAQASKAAAAARNTLYTCLDKGLRLLSPMMPFVTEELFQRLPRRASESELPSICVAKFPEDTTYRNTTLETEFNSALDLLRAIRSIKATYLPLKTKTDVYVVPLNDSFQKAVEPFSDMIATLANLSSLALGSKSTDVPDGCALETVPGLCEVHLLVKGLVDAERELEKFKARLKGVNDELAKLKKAMSIPNYETKVPENVRQQNDEKLAGGQIEIDVVTRGIAMYERILKGQ